jgi:hypothetical protein
MTRAKIPHLGVGGSTSPRKSISGSGTRSTSERGAEMHPALGREAETGGLKLEAGPG